jgi:hypothetical protein
MMDWGVKRHTIDNEDMGVAFYEGFFFTFCFGVCFFYLSCLGVIMEGQRYREGMSTSNHY